MRRLAAHYGFDLVGRIGGLLMLAGTMLSIEDSLGGGHHQFKRSLGMIVVGLCMNIIASGHSSPLPIPQIGSEHNITPREALRLMENPSSHHSWYRRMWRRIAAMSAHTIGTFLNAGTRMARASEVRRLQSIERMRNAVLLPHQRGLPAPQVNPETPSSATDRVRVVVETDSTAPSGVRVCVPGETADAVADTLAAEIQAAEAAGEFAEQPTPGRENSGNGSGEVSRNATAPSPSTNSAAVLPRAHRRRRVVQDEREPNRGAFSTEVDLTRRILSETPGVVPGAGAPVGASATDALLPSVAP